MSEDGLPQSAVPPAGVAAGGDEPAADGAVESREPIITYWALRLGILGAVLMLAISIVYERTQAPGCWQTSISAYFYTPARSIFVGALIAVGLCLIVIQGRGRFEDITLNLAGMLAPIVALVPTSSTGSCYSVLPEPPPTVKESGEVVLADWVVANIQNNLFALMLTGLIAVVAAVAFALVHDQPLTEGVKARTRFGRLTLSLVISLIVVGLGTALFAFTELELQAHFLAAILMFVFLGAAVLVNVLSAASPRPYRVAYAAILAAMLASLLFLLTGWDHSVLIVEILEVALFSLFWLLQTQELWSRYGNAAAVLAA